jgi:hypothetical protein
VTTPDWITPNIAALPDLAWLLTCAAEMPLARASGDADRPVVQLRTARDQWVTRHSRHDPIRDARRLVESALAAGPATGTVAVIGAGAGYIVDVLMATPAVTHVLVLEPHPPHARAMLARRDWRQALHAGRLTLLVGPAYAGAGRAWPALRDATPPTTIADPVLAREQAPLVTGAREVLGRIVFDAAANAQARAELSSAYAINTLRNLPALLAAPALSGLAGLATGWPAVVAGAGPSLWDNLAQVHTWRDRVVLVAVDTAVRPILARGVEPDYIVAVDPTSANTQHLTGLGALSHAWLIAESSVEPVGLEACGPRRCLFRLADNAPWPWLRTHGVDPGTLAVWGSVLTGAYSLATHLGCEVVHLIGADLAYTDDRPYSRGVTFEADWARQRLLGTPLRRHWVRQRTKRVVIDVPDVHGRPVHTAPHLIAFRDWIADRCAAGGPRVVNATGAGAFTSAAVTQAGPGALAALPGRPGPFRPEPPAHASLSADASRRVRHAITAGTRSQEALGTLLAGVVAPHDLDAALAQVGRALDDAGAPPVPVPAPAPPPTLLARALPFLDERVVNWCTARSGRRPEGGAFVALSSNHAAALEAAGVVLAHAVARPGLTTRELAAREPALPAHVPPEVRALLDLSWRQDAGSDALALLALATDGVARGGRLPVTWRPHRTGPRQPAAGDDRTVRRHRERRARWALTSLVSYVESLAAATLPPDRLALAHLLDQGPGEGPGGPVRLGLAVRAGDARWRMATTMSSVDLFVVLAGALLPPTDGSAPARADLGWSIGPVRAHLRIHLPHGVRVAHPCDVGRPHGWLEPTWVTDPKLRDCPMGAPVMGGHRCVLTPRRATASVVMDADGRHVPSRPWPMPLTGELHGQAWHVAWSQARDGQVAARRPGAETIVEADITGLPLTAAWIDPTRVVVTTTDGVWDWVPGSPARLLARLPASAIVSVEAGQVRLDPIPMRDGRYVPAPLDAGWTLDLATSTVRPRPLGPARQAWAEDRHAGVVATAHPEAHVVALSHARRTTWMAWPCPRGVAWVADTLIVWGADGRVGRVPGALAAARGEPRES